MLAGPSPEALIGPIAAATSRIRVGSGGVMLPHYSPFKVAETFSLLSGLFPGRIDLALGRAAGTDPLTTFALQRDRRQAAPDDFPQQLAELLAYLDDRMPEDHPFARLAKTLPGRPELPERVAARLLSAERHLGRRAGDAVCVRRLHQLRRRRDRGALSRTLCRTRTPDGRKPRTAVAVWVICAESDEQAQRLAASGRMTFTMLRRGELIAGSAAGEGARVPRRTSGAAPAAGQSRAQRRAVVGTPDAVRAELEDVAAKYGADELIAVNILYDHQARRHSYELLAEAFEMASARVDA